MGRCGADNPVHDMGNAVAELHKMADMAEIIIEAIFNGDRVTLQTVGNGMYVFLSQLRGNIARIEMLNGIIDSRFSWVYAIRGSDLDRCYGQESGGFEAYGDMLPFIRLLPEEQKERLETVLRGEAAARRQGFIEGYMAAAGKCAGNGGEDGGRT